MVGAKRCGTKLVTRIALTDECCCYASQSVMTGSGTDMLLLLACKVMGARRGGGLQEVETPSERTGVLFQLLRSSGQTEWVAH